MVSTPPPTTERLKFRPYRDTDASAVAEMFGDPEARRWYPAMIDREAALTWIRWNLDGYQTSGVGLWVVEDRLTSTFLGDCGLTY